MGGRFEDCLWESLVCLLLSASYQNLSSSYVRFANNRPPRLVKYIMSFTDFENLEGVAIGRIVDRKTQSTCGLIYQWSNGDCSDLWLFEKNDDVDRIFFNIAGGLDR